MTIANSSPLDNYIVNVALKTEVSSQVRSLESQNSLIISNSNYYSLGQGLSLNNPIYDYLNPHINSQGFIMIYNN